MLPCRVSAMILLINCTSTQCNVHYLSSGLDPAGLLGGPGSVAHQLLVGRLRGRMERSEAGDRRLVLSQMVEATL